MTHVILDDAMPQNPKIAHLNAGEFALLVESICYSGRHLTDGTLPKSGAKVMRFWTQTRAKALVTFGLWEQQSDGRFVIHDYDQYQRTKAQVEADKAANRERQERYRQRHRNGVTPKAGNALVTEPSNLILSDSPLPPASGGTDFPLTAPRLTREQRAEMEREQKRRGAVQRCRYLWNAGLEEGEHPDALRISLEYEYHHDKTIVAEAIGAP